MDQRVSEQDTAEAKTILGFSGGDAAEQKVATFSGAGEHGMRVATDHDEDARSNFMMDLYRHLGSNMAPGRRDVYDARIKPAFVKENGRPPKDRHEVRKAVRDDPYFQQRLEDAMAWARQAYNRTEAEYGWGKAGWVTEQYYHTYETYFTEEADGTVWVAYFPWTAGALLAAYALEMERARRA